MDGDLHGALNQKLRLCVCGQVQGFEPREVTKKRISVRSESNTQPVDFYNYYSRLLYHLATNGENENTHVTSRAVNEKFYILILAQQEISL